MKHIEKSKFHLAAHLALLRLNLTSNFREIFEMETLGFTADTGVLKGADDTTVAGLAWTDLTKHAKSHGLGKLTGA